MGSTLYRTPDAFYLVPDDVIPDPGPLVLRTLAGVEMQTEPTWVAHFRVTEAVARIHAKHELTKVASRLESTVQAAATALGQLEPSGDSGLSAIEDLSNQLQGLVRTFGSADLTTAAGREAVETELAGLQRTKDKAQLEGLVGDTHKGLGDLIQEIDAAPLEPALGEADGPEER